MSLMVRIDIYVVTGPAVVATLKTIQFYFIIHIYLFGRTVMKIFQSSEIDGSRVAKDLLKIFCMLNQFQ